MKIKINKLYSLIESIKNLEITKYLCYYDLNVKINSLLKREIDLELIIILLLKMIIFLSYQKSTKEKKLKMLSIRLFNLIELFNIKTCMFIDETSRYVKHNAKKIIKI